MGDGYDVGATEGTNDGFDVGVVVGELLGSVDGVVVGALLGELLGSLDGVVDGELLGELPVQALLLHQSQAQLPIPAAFAHLRASADRPKAGQLGLEALNLLLAFLLLGRHPREVLRVSVWWGGGG